MAKLKSYIGGYESYGYPYPFPILAFLKNVDGEIHKYLYQNRYYKSEKSKYSIEEWMNRVLEGKEKRHIKGNIPNE